MEKSEKTETPKEASELSFMDTQHAMLTETGRVPCVLLLVLVLLGQCCYAAQLALNLG